VFIFNVNKQIASVPGPSWQAFTLVIDVFGLIIYIWFETKIIWIGTLFVLFFC